MRTVLILQLLVSLLVTGWFANAAYHGWKMPRLIPEQTGRTGTHHRSGVIIYGGGSRSSGGSWGGGK